MKKQLYGLLPLLLALPLCANGLDDPRLSFFSITGYVVHPINESRTNLTRSLPIQVNATCYLRVTMMLMNANLRGNLINPTGDSAVKYLEGYVLVGTSQYEGSYNPGMTLSVQWTYPKDWLLDKNTVSLTIESRYSQKDASPHNYVIGFPAVIDHPTPFTFSAEGVLSKNTFSGMTLRYPSISGRHVWETDYQGFAPEFQNPYQNALPLDQAMLQSLNYDGLPERFAYRKAYLRLHHDDGSFQIGEEGGDAVEKWRDFPLRLGQPSSSLGAYSAFALSEIYAVSPDGRYMKNLSDKAERDLLTHRLYLPPVRNNESKTFSFSLYIEGAGELGQDSFEWDFKVYKDKNYFGSYPNSDYAVEVS